MRNVKPLVAKEELEGEWSPYPKTGETIDGLGRSSLIRLDKAKEIRSALLKRPGSKRGLRMVYVPSVKAYVERVAAIQRAELDRVANGTTTTTTSTTA